VTDTTEPIVSREGPRIDMSGRSAPLFCVTSKPHDTPAYATSLITKEGLAGSSAGLRFSLGGALRALGGPVSFEYDATSLSKAVLKVARNDPL